jgi:AraC-like DNA-binding protein
MSLTESRYFLTEVDKITNTIYCLHDRMGENRIEPHHHKKGQFLYTEGGLVYVTTQETTFFLPARHYMWIPPNTEHSIYSDSGEVVMRNLYFPVKKNEHPFYDKLAIYPVNDLLHQMILFTTNWNGNVSKLNTAHFSFLTALKDILPELSQFSLALSLPRVTDHRLQRITVYLDEHMHESVKFSEVASRFNFSQRTLSRLFHSDIGMSFVHFFTILRMMKALQLLLEEKMPISEVALNVGYGSVPTFSNTFFKIVGVRPSEYMKAKNVYIG